MNNVEKYNILQLALIEHYDKKIKNMNKEGLNIYTSYGIFREFREIDQWLLEWYEELDPYSSSYKSKKKVDR